MTTRENRSIHRKKKLSMGHFIHHKSKTDWPGTEHKAFTMRPDTNHLSHGMDLTEFIQVWLLWSTQQGNYKPSTTKMNANGLAQDLHEVSRLYQFTQQLQHRTKHSFTTKFHSHFVNCYWARVHQNPKETNKTDKCSPGTACWPVAVTLPFDTTLFVSPLLSPPPIHGLIWFSDTCSINEVPYLRKYHHSNIWN